jgi:hypothetical protein
MQGTSIYVLHDDEAGFKPAQLPDLINAYNVGVGDGRSCLRLARKALPGDWVSDEPGGEHLYSHEALKNQITGQIDSTHASAAQLAY